MRQSPTEIDRLAEELRGNLVDTLRVMGVIKTKPVEQAFRSVPRHLFVDRYYQQDRLVHVDPRRLTAGQLKRIYSDDALVSHRRRRTPISSTSQPALVAQMLEDLLLEPGMRVLEIGAGTGWNAALMGHMVGPGGSVHSVDIQTDVARRARKHVRRAGLRNVTIVTGDGGYGYPGDAPYDRIITTATCPDISPHWAEQLAPGGALLVTLQDCMGTGWCLCARLWKRRGHLRGEIVSAPGFMLLQGTYGAPAACADEKRVAGLTRSRRPRTRPLPWSRLLMRPHAWQWMLRDLLFFAQLEGMAVEAIGRQHALRHGCEDSLCLIDHERIELYGGDASYRMLVRITEKWIGLGGPRVRDSYRVEAWPAGARKRAPKDGWLLRREHSQLVFRLKAPTQV